jgi:hypothetical protein
MWLAGARAATQGRLVRRVLFWFFRRSAFVRDAVRREMQWEERFQRAG